MDPEMAMLENGTLVPPDPNQSDPSGETQAEEFLSMLLDDCVLQYDARSLSRYIWYGAVVFIGISAIFNLFWRSRLILR